MPSAGLSDFPNKQLCEKKFEKKNTNAVHLQNRSIIKMADKVINQHVHESFWKDVHDAEIIFQLSNTFM